MQYYSTNHISPDVTLREAIMHSSAPDGGLYLPRRIKKLPHAFFKNIHEMSAPEIAYFIANTFFGEEIPSDKIKRIGEETFTFSMPLVEIEPGIFVFELFHGPTGTFKDIGARYLARMHASIAPTAKSALNVLLATNGNSGCAVANGFHNVDGVNVFALYPKDTPQSLTSQIDSLGNNVYAIKVNGTIDDCRQMVDQALADKKLNDTISFTCANTLNIGRILPQAICFFVAYAKIKRLNPKIDDIVMSVPCGNGGNLLSGFISSEMGLPISTLVAACNSNAAFARYLQEDDSERPKKSIRTLAYAMDTCRPANLPRFEELCHGDRSILRKKIKASVCDDATIESIIKDVHARTGYVLDPHSAVAYKAIKDNLEPGKIGIVMATAQPSRSPAIMQKLLGLKIEPHQCQKRLYKGAGATGMQMHPTYPALKKYILQTQIV